MTEWKSLYKYEQFANDGIGIEILVKINRTLSEVDTAAAYKMVEELKESLMRESIKLDPIKVLAAQREKEKLLGLFSGRDIFVEEIPNKYCNLACCSHRPWFVVTTKKGRIIVGWRKRVISIEWDFGLADTSENVFPNEEVTKIGHSIHAWGLKEAKYYIDVLLG